MASKDMAKCEKTGETVRLIEGNFVGDPYTGEWKFVADGAPEEPGDYNVRVHDLLKHPASFVDWMAQLGEKTWFDPRKFFDFLDRLRDDNNLYNAL